MAGIKDAMKDVLALLKTIPITNGDHTATTPYVRVWNNQLMRLLANQGAQVEAFPMPAYFLEIMNGPRYEIIGQGYRDADLVFRIHILHEYYNANADVDSAGTEMEQDLLVFGLRDQLIATLTYFTPAGCGPLTCIVEEQDFDHADVYHYVCDFICNFTDAKGSRLDIGRTYYVQSPSPLTGEVDVDTHLTGVQPQPFEQKPFLIPKQ